MYEAACPRAWPRHVGPPPPAIPLIGCAHLPTLSYVEVVAVKLAPSNSLVGVVVDFNGDERFDLLFRHVPGGGPTGYPEVVLLNYRRS